jgi:serine phosphatase RsbU (regulator of sigma subunit)
MTGLTRHTIRAAALHGRSPAAVLGDLNRLLLDAAAEQMAAWLPPDDSSGPSFCTVCLAEVTPTEGGARVVVSAAGHPLPFLVRSSGDVEAAGRPGSLLGVMTELQVTEEACELSPGDALVLFTDGITERRRDRALFEDDLPATLQTLAGVPAAELARRVEEAAVSFGVEEPDDDMAVLAISVPSRPVRADVPSNLLHHAGLAPT